MPEPHEHTLESITTELTNDSCVKLAGIDADGQLRGKLVSKAKFLSVATSGFGFCSVIFGWDMHDQTYVQELGVSNAANGYRDILAKISLASFRRIPWEKNVPFFLVSFFDPETDAPIPPCPRNLLAAAVGKVEQCGWRALAGAEYEFFNFRENPTSLADKSRSTPLQHLTPGMFGYSLTRPVLNQEFYYGVFDACKAFRVDLEGWHTESGPGVYEAALEYGEVREMADRASLFKCAQLSSIFPGAALLTGAGT